MAVYIYLVSAIFVLLYLIYKKICSKLSYWYQKGIKGPKPQIPYGNYKTVFDKVDSIFTLTEKLYIQYSKEKVIGIYQGLTPALIIRDPDLIKRVLKTDFRIFTDRGFKITDEPASNNIFTEDGKNWRIMRQKLSPIFTAGKLTNMMPLINNCVSDYMKNLENLVAKQASWDIRILNLKYIVKVITTIGFGLDVEIFNDEKDVFLEMAHKMVYPNKWALVALFLHSISPGLPDKLGVKLVPPEVQSFFTNLVNQVIKEREGKPKVRKDFMDLMIELKEQGTVYKSSKEQNTELEITDLVIIAQACMFYVAGIETSAGAMSYLLYELALNPSVQDRCFKEIKDVMAKYNEELTYESLTEFHYTNMAFKESLRKHATGGVLLRQAVDDFTFPEINLTIPKGMKIIIPVSSLHMDENYYSDPETFKPERFAPENKSLIQDSPYWPFGEGPRKCIGMKFGKMQSIVGIIHFLYRYRVEPCEKTVRNIRPDPVQLVKISLDGLWLNIVRRQV